jgi:hypothetical protein
MFRRMCHFQMSLHLSLPIERMCHLPQCIQRQPEVVGLYPEVAEGEKAVEGEQEITTSQQIPFQREGGQGQEEEEAKEV